MKKSGPLWLYSVLVLPAVCIPRFHLTSRISAQPDGLSSVGINNGHLVNFRSQQNCAVTKKTTNNKAHFKRFLPTCVNHLRELVHDLDRAYTDVQLRTVLEHECMMEEHFPLTKEDGFEANSHCKDFACLLVSARGAELHSKGDPFAYTRACESYWELKYPNFATNKMSAGASPMYSTASMPAVSTGLLCIINLTLQYFFLYTALAILRTLTSFQCGKNLVGVQQILESACSTVTYAPMLCVLFLGARMRAIQLTQGQTEKYHLPQPWVQTAMIVTSYAVVAQVVLVLLVAIVSGQSSLKTDEDGNVDTSAMAESGYPVVAKALTFARYIVMIMLYGGFMAVVVGVFQMPAPREIWGDEEVPVSPAVMCTVMLSAIFFMIYLLCAISRTCFELSTRASNSPALLKLEAAASQAKLTVNFAPMLCILFLAARQRALQLDPKHGKTELWAQKCFFLCTFSILLQAVLVILLPFMAKGQCRRGAFEGDIAFGMDNKILGAVMTGLRYLCLIALYGGIAGVMYSVFVMKQATGVTPPVSPAMKCVINLAMQYFTIYLVLFVCITIKSFVGTGRSDAENALREPSRFSRGVTKAILIVDAARGTVMFAPMLAILFVGARMRALQLSTSANGSIPAGAGPQAWVQDAMFLCTWSVLVQLIMAITVPLLTGADKPEADENGMIKVPADTPRTLAVVAEVIRYINLIFMYAGAMMIVVGIFAMKPSDLPPYNSQNIIPGVQVPGPPLPSHASEVPPPPDMPTMPSFS